MDAAGSNQKRRFDIRQNSQPKMYKDVHFWRWGMGRSFNGSYAEYALLPTHHVFAIQSDMTWADIAAVPETYFTAWASLFQCLRLQKDDTLLVRGGTCALGYAAMQIAREIGCRIAATTHRESKLNLLKDGGADECVLDTGNLSETYNGRFTKALELVGCKTLRDTLWCMAALCAIQAYSAVCSHLSISPPSKKFRAVYI